ncbi:hypothetical protein [Dysgonomonas macrotermitis]|nr:hypothetical protein [Dysgonomonas macrotermitis]
MMKSSIFRFVRFFIRYLPFRLSPEMNIMYLYVGKTVDQIIAKHKYSPIFYVFSPAFNKQSYGLVLEVRTERATLACSIQNGVCTDARLFLKSESVPV